MCVPVITSNISPMKEIVNKSAILVNPKDINDIKKKLKNICFDSKLRKTIIKKGYLNSLNFNPEVSKYAEIKTDVLFSDFVITTASSGSLDVVGAGGLQLRVFGQVAVIPPRLGVEHPLPRHALGQREGDLGGVFRLTGGRGHLEWQQNTDQQ